MATIGTRQPKIFQLPAKSSFPKSFQATAVVAYLEPSSKGVRIAFAMPRRGEPQWVVHPEYYSTVQNACLGAHLACKRAGWTCTAINADTYGAVTPYAARAHGSRRKPLPKR
jgi:hypothetical protein